MPKRIRMISDPRAMFGPLCNTDGEAGGGVKPADKPDGAPAPKEGDDKGADDGKGKADPDDWRGRFEGQQKVNRDLEGKLNTLRDGLKTALGIEDKKADATELVTKLQEQLNQLAHDNLVESAARRHGITEEDDLALLRTAKDPEAMEKLAARLAPKADEGDKSKPGKPGAPKPDLSQGKAGGGAGVRSLADAMDDYRAQLAKKKQTTP